MIIWVLVTVVILLGVVDVRICYLYGNEIIRRQRAETRPVGLGIGGQFLETGDGQVRGHVQEPVAGADHRDGAERRGRSLALEFRLQRDGVFPTVQCGICKGTAKVSR